jgi:hypothetical protein
LTPACRPDGQSEINFLKQAGDIRQHAIKHQKQSRLGGPRWQSRCRDEQQVQSLRAIRRESRRPGHAGRYAVIDKPGAINQGGENATKKGCFAHIPAAAVFSLVAKRSNHSWFDLRTTDRGTSSSWRMKYSRHNYNHTPGSNHLETGGYCDPTSCPAAHAKHGAPPFAHFSPITVK